ncbi:MAG: hypothetical protein JWO04_3504 [Gammaproteobacteria bacterium]|nr:hypothetical protein [Gammaproteobacteria bacterium]
MKPRDFFKTAGIGSAPMLSLPALTGVLAEPAWARSEFDGPPADTFSVLQSELLRRAVTRRFRRGDAAVCAQLAWQRAL